MTQKIKKYITEAYLNTTYMHAHTQNIDPNTRTLKKKEKKEKGKGGRNRDFNCLKQVD